MRSNRSEFPWLVYDVSTDEVQAACSNKETAETLARQLNQDDKLRKEAARTF